MPTPIIYTLDGTGTEIPAINVALNTSEIIIQGTATAIGNYAIAHTGTPNITTQINIAYRGTLDITTNGTTFSILGQSLNQNDLNRELEITARWTGAAWKVITKKDFKESGIIEASHMSTNSVATAAIQDDAITTSKILDGAVTTPKIADDAVTAAKINADVAGLGLSQAISGALDVNVDNSTLEISTDTLQVKDLGITTGKINNLAVTSGKLADSSVTTAKILNDNVTTAKIADDNVTNAKLAEMPTLTVKANITGSTANPTDVALASLFGLDTTKWSTTGNAGTTPGTNFIGTTDAQDLVFKVNNVEAGRIQSSGNGNTSFGKSSLISNTTGLGNTAFGANSLENNNGDVNSAFGAGALFSNNTGINNSGFGYQSLFNTTSGVQNTALGHTAGDTITTGDNNTIIGFAADVSSASATNRIALGEGALADQDYQFALPDNVVTWKVLGLNQSLPYSGTYTPTLTNVTNIDSSTAFACQYMRVGSMVTVSGKVTIDPTASSATELGMSLPIASNFANEEELAGNASDGTANNHPVRIKADATNNRAAFVFNPSGTGSADYSFVFMYQII